MERQSPRRSHARRPHPITLLVVSVTAVVTLLAAPVAEAQYDSGSRGIHGSFPPVPSGMEQAPTPPDIFHAVWNVRTGFVRYCYQYTLGSMSEQCNGNAYATAQIPGIPAGGLTSGVYEFTNVNIPAGLMVVPVGYSPNTPIAILSQTDIVIGGGSAWGPIGSLWFNGWQGGNSPGSPFAQVGGKGGPGGFDGGNGGGGGDTPGHGAAGMGPVGGAGGRADASTYPDLYGSPAASSPSNPSLTPLAGGSGGGGGAGQTPTPLSACSATTLGAGGAGGGGGGGALLLAASGTITIHGAVYAYGGQGGNGYGSCGTGGYGAGGSVRLVAQTINGGGSVAVGGNGNNTARPGGGYVRLEAAVYSNALNISNAAGGSFLTFPTAAIPTNQPALRITTVNGVSAPQNPTAQLATPDITFADAISNAVNVGLAAANVPPGTAIDVRVVPATGAPVTATSSPLVGSLTSSTASASVALPPGAGVITASATFSIGGSGGGSGGMARRDLPKIDGRDVERVEVLAAADGSSRAYLVADSGARFELGTTLPQPMR